MGRSTPARRALAGVAALACLVVPASAATARKEGAEDARPARSAGTESGRREMGFFATTMGQSGFEVVLVHYWSKGTRFRSETVVAGHPIVTLVRGDEYYTWDALTREGYVVRRTASAIAADARRPRPFGTELNELVAEGGEKIRSETLNGVRVDVYRVTDEDGRRTLWVDAERLDLPIRLETYDRASGRTGRLDWLNWIPGLVMPDTFFEPPEGLNLRRYESYEAYIEQLGRAPTPPTPPLFHYLLHEREPERDGDG
jgi:hypothetical protein